MKIKTSVKNKTRMKNKTHKGVGGKKLRSKTNRRKYKSRFSKKTLKGGVRWFKLKRNGGKKKPDKAVPDKAEQEMKDELYKKLSEVDELIKKLKKLKKSLKMSEDPGNGNVDDIDADEELLKELEALEALEAEGEDTLSKEEKALLAELNALTTNEEEKVKGGTRTPDEIKKEIKIMIATLKRFRTENNNRIERLSALTDRNTEQEKKLQDSREFIERLTLLQGKIKKCVGLLSQIQKHSTSR